MASKARIKIVHAFLDYVKTHDDLSHLNILELTRLSDVNRVTFYRQFKDLSDFYKWFILKDFIFHHEDAPSFTFKEAFLKVFHYIANFRGLLQKIFASSHGPELKEFIQSEVFAYQMRNFHRIDGDNILSKEEVYAHASFYASGITLNILQYIQNPRFFKVSPIEYTAMNLRIVKDYVERAIARKIAKAYDDIKEDTR